MVEIRRLKAEGGWGVVCTEQVEIHPTSDMMPITELRLWDDRDVPVVRRHRRRHPRARSFGSFGAVPQRGQHGKPGDA